MIPCTKNTPTAKPAISIIMAVYNAEKWLGMCIESILWQKETSWELLIIDDFSTDTSCTIATNYAQLDSRIRLISNCHTKGVSGARNTGLDVAQGNYISFVDCDDILLPHMYSSLLSSIEQHENDTPFLHAFTINHDLLHFRTYKTSLTEEQTRLHATPNDTIPRSMMVHFFAKNFLEQHNLRQNEELHCSEDTLFMLEAYKLVKHIPCINEHVYVYMQNHKKINYSAQYTLSMVSALLYMLEKLSADNTQERLLPYIKNYFFPKWLYILYVLPSFPQDIQNTILKKSMHIFSFSTLSMDIALTPILKEHTKNFLALCKQEKTKEAIELLQKNNFIKQGPMYMGTERHFSPRQLFQYSLLRKIYALCSNTLTRRVACIMFKLRLRAFLRKTTLNIKFSKK